MTLPLPLIAFLQWSGCVIAASLVPVAACSVIPPATMPLLALRIAATEGGPWLAAAALAIALAAVIPRRRLRLTTVTLLLAAITAALALLPLRFLSATIARADAGMALACGPAWRDPPAGGPAPRPHPFALRDCWRGIPHEAVTETPIEMPANGGLALPALRYQGTQAGARQPVVIAIHGGGWHGGAIDECASCQRYLAAHGYLVFAIDYRDAPATRFPGQLDDVQAALAWIEGHAAESGGDPTRIVLLGRSAGAQLALLAAYARPDPAIRAVVSWYGPVDLAGGYREPPRPDPLDVRALLGDYLGGDPDQQPERYRLASPIAYATRPLPPTLLIAGVADHGVVIGFQRIMRDRLRASGTPVALIELPWAEHAFDRVASGPGAQISLFYVERFLAWAVAR